MNPLDPLPKENTRASFRFNGGKGAMLCTTCKVIIRQGRTLTTQDWDHANGNIVLPPQYCTTHEKT